MQIIGTFFLTHYVVDWLRNSSQPRILHIFDPVCNLINERNEVLSIATPQIGNGPFNLVVEEDVLFSKYLNTASPIFISDNRLTLGELVINTASAGFWNPRPDWESLHKIRDHVANQMAQLTITNYSALLNHRHSPVSDSLISNLCHALVQADISSAENIASRLAGLGIGLTPAGDDFMVGALYAAWIIHPLEITQALAQEIANTAAARTTSLSAAWLRSAGRAEAGFLWHEFLAALISGDIPRIQSSTDNILAVGATSGADALAGFTRTLVAYLENQKKYVIPKFI